MLEEEMVVHLDRKREDVVEQQQLCSVASEVHLPPVSGTLSGSRRVQARDTASRGVGTDDTNDVDASVPPTLDGDRTTPLDDGVRRKTFPLHAAGLYRLLLLRVVGCAADRTFLRYLQQAAPIIDDRSAPPSTTISSAFVELEKRQLQHLTARLAAIPGLDQEGAPLNPRRLVTTSNLREIDAGRFYLSEQSLLGVAMLVPFCVNLKTIRLTDAANASSRVIRLLLHHAARHPTLTQLDFRGTFIDWDDLDLLARSITASMRITEVLYSPDLCAYPAVGRARLANALSRNASVPLVLAVRGSYDPTPFDALLRRGVITPDEWEPLWVPSSVA